MEEDFSYHFVDGLWSHDFSTENNINFDLMERYDERIVYSVDINNNYSIASESILVSVSKPCMGSW